MCGGGAWRRKSGRRSLAPVLGLWPESAAKRGSDRCAKPLGAARSALHKTVYTERGYRCRCLKPGVKNTACINTNSGGNG